MPIYQTAVNDSSYTVAGAALKGLIALDGDNAYNTAKKYSNDAKGALGSAITEVLIAKGTEADFEFISNAYKNAPPNQDKVTQSTQFASYLTKLNDVSNIKKGVDYMMEFRNLIPKEYWSFIDPTFQAAFDKIIKAKGGEVETYIKSVFK